MPDPDPAPSPAADGDPSRDPAPPAVDLTTPRSIHIIGVGGAGMSAIATVLAAMGHRVTGSDLKSSAGFERLRVDGVEVTVDHTGRVVRGSGTFRVEPDGPDRSMVVWIENLSIPGGAVGRFLWRASRPVSKWAVTHSLRRFAAQVESRSPAAAAA